MADGDAQQVVDRRLVLEQVGLRREEPRQQLRACVGIEMLSPSLSLLDGVRAHTIDATVFPYDCVRSMARRFTTVS